MQTADLTTKATLISYFPERIQAALSAYASELNLSPETLVQLGIGSFLESAEISAGVNEQDLPDDLTNQGILAHLPSSMQKGIEQYAAEYEFPPESVVELAVTFLLDPDASSFEDCHIDIGREQTQLLQQYYGDRKAEAA